MNNKKVWARGDPMNLLPKKPGVYYLFKHSDTKQEVKLVYVGMSGNLYYRLNYHQQRYQALIDKLEGREIPISYNPVNGIPFDVVEYELIGSDYEARFKEIEQIKQKKPYFNNYDLGKLEKFKSCEELFNFLEKEFFS